MLKLRIITALILIPIIVLLVLKLPPIVFCIFTLAIVLWGAWEWSAFMGLKKLSYRILYLIIMLFLLVFSLNLPIVEALYASAVWWLVALALVFVYPRYSSYWGKNLALRGLMGLFVLIPCWLAVNYIHSAGDYGPYKLLFLFVLIWGADTGAYFVGKKWGKHKLAPSVSPGKTWQGLCGALLVTTLISMFVAWWDNLPYIIWPAALVLSLVTVLFSIVGDLFESMLKRNAGLKDSGQLLPGHGGILDRIDSLTAAAPMFVVGSLLLGKIFN